LKNEKQSLEDQLTDEKNAKAMLDDKLTVENTNKQSLENELSTLNLRLKDAEEKCKEKTTENAKNLFSPDSQNVYKTIISCFYAPSIVMRAVSLSMVNFDQ
jgi:chromosome segregation ATPase